ncbi:hypothetical protein TYRP_023055, partial [Tyrophagus putrescentiae]
LEYFPRYPHLKFPFRYLALHLRRTPLTAVSRLPASAAANTGATVASFAVQTPTRAVMPPPPLLLLIAPVRALCFGVMTLCAPWWTNQIC